MSGRLRSLYDMTLFECPRDPYEAVPTCSPHGFQARQAFLRQFDVPLEADVADAEGCSADGEVSQNRNIYFGRPKLRVLRGGALTNDPVFQGYAEAEIGFERVPRLRSFPWKRRIRAGALASAGILVWAYGLPTLLVVMERTAEAVFGA